MRASSGWNVRLNKQVPAEYFLLTFTLPAEFRALSWAHQSVVYELLMQLLLGDGAYLQPER
mgnify:CR=1 FL=1